MMKLKTTTSLFALLLSSAMLYAADTGTVTVNFSNVSNDKGVVRAALFNSAQAFETKGDASTTAFAKNYAPISNSQSTVTFTQVPYGTYAVKAFHDQDMSGTIPRGMFGKPKTDYGFSNNPNVSGLPSFEQASFTVNAANTVVPIQMIN